MIRALYQSSLWGAMPYNLHISLCSPYPAHWHEEFEIMYVLSGRVSVRIDGEPFELSPGDAVCIASAAVHEVGKSENARALTMEIGDAFLGEEFAAVAHRRFPEPLLHLEDGTPWKAELRAELTRLSEIVRSGEKGGFRAADRWQCCAGLFSVAALLALYDRTEEPSADQQARLVSLRQMQDVFTLVQEHYMEELNLEWAAQTAGYEVTRFCQLFRQTAGVTFHHYLNAFRVDMARAMLSGTGMPIGQIGEACGMPFAKSFCRIFRDYCGMTPSEYRQKSGGKDHSASAEK